MNIKPLSRFPGIISLLIGLPLAGQAQSCLPLQGHWAMNAEQSQLAAGLSFNPFYRVDQVELTLSRPSNSNMTQKWRFAGPHIHDEITYSFTIDGRSQKTGAHSALDSVPLEVTPAWQNCTLIVDARSSLFGTDVWTHNVYVLDRAGQRLSVLQTGRSGIGHVERTLVFDKTGQTP